MCVDRGSGTPVLFENTIDSPQTFRGKTVRVNLGKTDVQIRKNGRPVTVASGPGPRRLRVHGPRAPAAAARRTALRVSARAGIVVTGTEVLSGRVQDRNGPWLSDRLLELGVELAHITICGDRPQDIEAQLRFLADQGVDLILTSGGLGPTADDMTVEVVARFSGRELVLDEQLEQRIYRDPRAAHEALPALGPRRDAGRQPQAGADPGGRDGDRPRRDGARRDRARASRSWWCCPVRRASCSRCGAWRSRASPYARPSPARTDYEQATVRHVRAARVRARGDAA